MNIPSLLRIQENKALAKLVLNGSVLDIGGDKNSEYTRLIKGEHTMVTINLDPRSKPDIVHDLEKPLPINDAEYDNVLLINVLEHIFEYRALLKESVRVLKPQGTLVIVVPFMFPVHPSPEDYHRYTASTLMRELAECGCTNVNIVPLGTGVFSARYVAIDRLLPWPVRLIRFWTTRFWVYGLDVFFTALSRALKKRYSPADYARGYCVTAIKR